MNEAQVQSRIRAILLGRYGIDADKTWGNAMNPGVPDLFCGAFWIEVKAPKKKLRPSQVAWCEKWDPKGARVYVCDDPSRLIEILSGPPNWRDYAPKRSHRDRLSRALNDWAT